MGKKGSEVQLIWYDITHDYVTGELRIMNIWQIVQPFLHPHEGQPGTVQAIQEIPRFHQGHFFHPSEQ